MLCWWLFFIYFALFYFSDIVKAFNSLPSSSTANAAQYNPDFLANIATHASILSDFN